MTEVHVIEWLDAVATHGWEDFGFKEGPHRCTSVGFVAHEDDEYVIVAATFAAGPPAQTNNRISIPKGWITARRILSLRGKSVLKRSRKSGKTPAKAGRRRA